MTLNQKVQEAIDYSSRYFIADRCKVYIGRISREEYDKYIMIDGIEFNLRAGLKLGYDAVSKFPFEIKEIPKKSIRVLMRM